MNDCLRCARDSGRDVETMPTRARLAALAHELRHARTALLPLDIGERAQHLIVRIEELLASPMLDPSAADALSRQARQLLDECDALSPKR